MRKNQLRAVVELVAKYLYRMYAAQAPATIRRLTAHLRKRRRVFEASCMGGRGRCSRSGNCTGLT